MKQIIQTLLLALVFLTGGFRGYAAGYADIGNFKYLLIDSTAIITGYADNVNIDAIVTLDIPSNVTYEGTDYSVIGVEGDLSSNNLERIIIPSTIRGMSSSRFGKLTTVISYMKSPFSYNYPFTGYPYGLQIYIPRGTLNAYREAGWSVGNVQLITMPDFVQDGFSYNITDKEKKAVELTSGSVDNKYTDLLYGDITIPSKVSYNGIDYDVTSIRSGAFYGCRSISSIAVPQSVDSIGIGAFAYCTNLKTLNLDCKTINHAISSTSIKKIILGANVCDIGKDVFKYCKEIVEFVVDEQNKKYSSDSMGTLFDKNKSTLLRFPSRPAEESYTIPDGVSRIENFAFYWSTLRFINIPNSITQIGKKAFCNSYIEDLTIPSSVESIGDNAFDSSNVRTVTIHSPLKEVGNAMFLCCRLLESVSLDKNIKRLGDYCFKDCYRLVDTVVLPDSLERIDTGLFQGCGARAIMYCIKTDCGIKSMIIPKSVKSIGSHAFDGCIYLSSLNDIPDGVTSIGDYAFCNTRFTSVNLPNSVREIGDYAFKGCTYLVSASLPSSVTNVGENIFEDCKYFSTLALDCNPNNWFKNTTTVQTIKLGPSVATVSGSSFSGCSNLQTIAVSEENNVFCSVDGTLYSKDRSMLVYLPRKRTPSAYTISDFVTDIGDGAFQDNTNLQEVTIPYRVRTIGSNAFNGCTNLKVIYAQPTIPPAIKNTTFPRDYKATLHIPAGSMPAYGSAAYWQLFVDRRDDLTGIQSPLVTKGGQSPWYDLQGRPVTRPEKGRIYIHDGRKVVR